jgi:MinD superfamily P-loop ATPase
VKSEAKSVALRENHNLIIADGSPGIGCPVVSSLAGATYVILVTEPTMSGLHDLNIKQAYDHFKNGKLKEI